MATPLGVQVNPSSLRSFLHACDQAEGDTRKEMQATFRKVGEFVRKDARSRMLPKHARSAVGYVTFVQSRGVRVEQSIPKTTGLHREFGRWQMKHVLLPALRSNTARIDSEFERATDKVCDRFESEADVDWLVIEGVRPYDGRYPLDLENQEFTTREWGWIKRLANYLPLTAADGFAGSDPELACAIAVILLRRAGIVDTADVATVYERLADAPYTASLRWEFEPDSPDGEGDAGDPTESSDANTSFSGPGSRTSSETLDGQPSLSGTPASATSVSDRATLVS